MADTNKREYAKGTYTLQTFPWGFYYGGRVMCSDGVVRQLKRIASTPDTFFSIPAAVAVKGKTVSGFVSFSTVSGSDVATDDDPTVAKFIAVSYGKNHKLLPDGSWSQ